MHRLMTPANYFCFFKNTDTESEDTSFSLIYLLFFFTTWKIVRSLPEPNFTLIFVPVEMKILVDLYVLHKCAGDFERVCCGFLEQTSSNFPSCLENTN